ncbi:hypothetical protein [Saccharomonospora glauca]|uniref:Uncharacterized protein n=1 Tax=Saccharomonospora glauca K62 TaxID=928724 RepID=H1JNY7_9PSEU|nr:hypothetical protein [Saccharomonospora glauca]EIF01236.1 hypothetical protein SacglDRAFT_00022 [Saccharomonospora glauca K62]
MPTVPIGDAITRRIVIRPAEVPACELPESEPTLADLLAIEYGDDVLVQRRIDQALRLSAFEHTHRELMELRRRYRDLADEDEVDTTPTFWRAA